MNDTQFINALFDVCPEKATMFALKRIEQRGELDLFDEFLTLMEAGPSPERNAALDAWYAKLAPTKQRDMADDIVRLKMEAQVAQ